jgi:hypothetical protein
MSDQNKTKGKYWYRVFVGECPVCGRDKSYRERVYGDKPIDPNEIYKQLSHQQTYDHCMER